MAKRRTWWTREFKLAAIARMEAAPRVGDLAAELGINRGLLLKWRRAYEAGGASALKFPGERAGVAPPPRPPVAPSDALSDDLAVARHRVAELERKVGQQQLDLDFFREALRRVEAPTPKRVGRIGKASTP